MKMSISGRSAKDNLRFRLDSRRDIASHSLHVVMRPPVYSSAERPIPMKVSPKSVTSCFPFLPNFVESDGEMPRQNHEEWYGQRHSDVQHSRTNIPIRRKKGALIAAFAIALLIPFFGPLISALILRPTEAWSKTLRRLHSFAFILFVLSPFFRMLTRETDAAADGQVRMLHDWYRDPRWVQAVRDWCSPLELHDQNGSYCFPCSTCDLRWV